MLLLSHPYRPRYHQNYEMGVGPGQKQGLNSAFEHAWSANHKHAARSANTSFCVDSTAIGARVSAQCEVACTNRQIKRAKHVGGSRDSTWQSEACLSCTPCTAPRPARLQRLCTTCMHRLCTMHLCKLAPPLHRNKHHILHFMHPTPQLTVEP